MRGTKTLQLPFEFEYSDGGTYVTTNEVTLTAPGIDRFHVHATMHAYVMDALFAMAKRAVELQGASEARKNAEEEEYEGDDQQDKKEIEGKEFFDQLALGMGIDKFPNFVTYVKKILTNNVHLARVGQGKMPITDETWERIEEAGGMEAVKDIIGTFSSFFVNSPGASKANGSEKLPISSSPSKAGSPTSTSTRSRSKN